MPQCMPLQYICEITPSVNHRKQQHKEVKRTGPGPLPGCFRRVAPFCIGWHIVVDVAGDTQGTGLEQRAHEQHCYSPTLGT